jgi:Na+/alanine symporter
MGRVAAITMAGQGGHGWMWFQTRFSLSFDFSHATIMHEKVRKERGSLGTRLAIYM